MNYRCSGCGHQYPISRLTPWCECGSSFDLDFEPERLQVNSADFSLWRYADALPVRSRVSIGEPLTPIVAARIDGREVEFKLDYLFPTGSFKDRGSAILISGLKDAGITRFMEDSSGNAGASMAAYAARAGMSCEIYCPEHASPSKLNQVKRAGAAIHRIPGPRAATTEVVMGLAGTICYASHNWNPLFLHGTKTAAYEIAEQCGWDPPDHIVAPVGGGSVLLGLDLGFRELEKLGRIQRRPRLHGVQAAACAPLVHGPVEAAAPSLAEGIMATKPPRMTRLKQVLASVVEVSEPEIQEGFDRMASMGFAVEPTSAVVYHGLARLALPAHERVLVILTGSGLKFSPQRP